ncbi:hypothetical protein DXV76_05965 [Rhodobacteraceae bacterium CCMM004]|nr:hypothetical protein DXV76_05965 [Rhodobacteraceae bacterium CCMM004]
MSPALTLLASITDVAPADAGRVAVSGSHGGGYAGMVASRGGLRAAVFNDAGIGLDHAGVAGVMALEQVGMAAAAYDTMTARIGDAEDALRHGIVSFANGLARDLGVAPGMTVAQAAVRLERAPEPRDRLPHAAEARQVRRLPGGVEVTLLDSVSLVGEGDAGALVVTGSHGGLVGGDPQRALKAAARVAVFNDAGGGKDGSGRARLPALDARGIAGATVAHSTARIGDAVSALDTGVLSAVNQSAEALGARVGDRLADWLARIPPPS